MSSEKFEIVIRVAEGIARGISRDPMRLWVPLGLTSVLLLFVVVFLYLDRTKTGWPRFRRRAACSVLSISICGNICVFSWLIHKQFTRWRGGESIDLSRYERAWMILFNWSNLLVLYMKQIWLLRGDEDSEDTQSGLHGKQGLLDGELHPSAQPCESLDAKTPFHPEHPA